MNSPQRLKNTISIRVRIRCQYDHIGSIGTWVLKNSYAGLTDFENTFKSANSSASLYVNEYLHMAYLDVWAYNVSQLTANTSYTVLANKLPATYKPMAYNAVTGVYTEVSGAFKTGYGYYANGTNNVGLNMKETISANNYNRFTFLYIYV